MNKLYILVFCLIGHLSVYSQKGEKSIWTNYKTTLILNKDGRFAYDYGYKYWKEKGNLIRKSELDSIYTGTFEKKLNKIVLTLDMPYKVTQIDTILNGTLISVENISYKECAKCHSLFRIVKGKEVTIAETDFEDNGLCFINGRIDSLYISLSFSKCKTFHGCSYFNKKGKVDEQISYYWYPVFLKDTFYNKKIFIKFYRDIENKEKFEYQTILKIKYFPKRLYLDEFDILYNGKSIKKGVFTDEKGKLYYKQNGIRLYF